MDEIIIRLQGGSHYWLHKGGVVIIGNRDYLRDVLIGRGLKSTDKVYGWLYIADSLCNLDGKTVEQVVKFYL